MDIPRATICVATVVNLAELFNFLDEEIRYIWITLIDDMSILKILYLIARYLPFVLYAQQFVMGDSLEHLAEVHRTAKNKALWVLYKTCAMQFFLWAFDFTLLKRVYLLFGGTRMMGLGVFLLALIKLFMDINIAYEVYSLMLLNDTVKSETLEKVGKLVLTYAIGEISLQILLFVLASKGTHWSKQKRSPVISRLVTYWVEQWVVAFVILACPMVYMYAVEISPCAFSFITMGLSVADCRLILYAHRAFYHKRRTTNFDNLAAVSDDDDEDKDDGDGEGGKPHY